MTKEELDEMVKAENARAVNALIVSHNLNHTIDTELVSDGYHTFGELYKFRLLYNALLFNEWAAAGKYGVQKSMRHSDGELCFGGDWFVVCAMLPDGLISNHYHVDDWDKFKIPIKERAEYEYDGHTTEDVMARLSNCCYVRVETATINSSYYEEPINYAGRRQ